MILKNKVNEDDKRLMCLSFLLFIQIFLDFVKVFLRGDSSSVTYTLYIASLVYIVFSFRRDLTMKTIGILSLSYSIFAFSYLTFPETRTYYNSDGFILLCVYFIPAVFLVVRRIRNWDNFFHYMSLLGAISVLMGIYIVFFSGVDNYSADERYFTYMEFSYAQLPFVCSLYQNARDKKSWYLFPFFIIGFIEMFAFGSRATVLFVLLFVLLSELVNRSNKIEGILVLLVIAMIVIYNFDGIISGLTSISGIGDSYVLRHILSGELFQYETREIIYTNCQNRINSMGMDISGFFGDRKYCGSIYPHNILYEILMQWGWILGLMLLLYLLFLLIKSFFSSQDKVVLIFLVCCLLGRYFFSGTYVIEGRFWVFYGCLLALSSRTIKLKYE